MLSATWRIFSIHILSVDSMHVTTGDVPLSSLVDSLSLPSGRVFIPLKAGDLKMGQIQELG